VIEKNDAMASGSIVMNQSNRRTWDDAQASFRSPHFLQSGIWGDLKEEVGWTPHYLLWKDDAGKIAAGAMILQRTVKILSLIPVTILYCPKGPQLSSRSKELLQKVLEDIVQFSRQRKALFVKIDLDFIVGYENSESIPPDKESEWIELPQHLKEFGWILSLSQVQFRNTFLLNVLDTEEEILKQMKQKTRYNIRLSERKGVTVRKGTREDFETLYRLYAQTALRDGFVIRNKEYYFSNWYKFLEAGHCIPLIAEFNNQILAAVIIYLYGGRATYIYGMSADINRNLMATYLLQWRAIQIAKEEGCKVYDFWGAPDEIDEQDKLWGLYKFKSGFAGIFTRYIGAWDYVINHPGYFVYNNLLPLILDGMRKIGIRKTREEIS
jgi:peptidoglycan pentaglycine glycine transferase (the first glycine)